MKDILTQVIEEIRRMIDQNPSISHPIATIEEKTFSTATCIQIKTSLRIIEEQVLPVRKIKPKPIGYLSNKEAIRSYHVLIIITELPMLTFKRSIDNKPFVFAKQSKQEISHQGYCIFVPLLQNERSYKMHVDETDMNNLVIMLKQYHSM